MNAFIAMSTQWRIGMNGPTGLDYSALREVWQRTRVPPSARDEAFDSIRIMEEAALVKMRADQKQSRKTSR